MAEYSFTLQLKKIVRLLWNNGKPRTLTLDDFADKAKKGAYGMHSRLSYGPWKLVEDHGDNHHRRLTKRGQNFAQGKLKIPKKIEGTSPTYTAVPGTPNVGFGEIRDP